MKMCPATAHMRVSPLRQAWNKFKSLMLERNHTGCPSEVQSLFLLELYTCGCGFENHLGVSLNQLGKFDSLFARFEDQCLLSLFEQFDRFKLSFLQEESGVCGSGLEKENQGICSDKTKQEFQLTPSCEEQNDCGAQCEKEIQGMCNDENMQQFTASHTQLGFTQKDCLLINKHVSETKLTFENRKNNEGLKDDSLFVTTEGELRNLSDVYVNNCQSAREEEVCVASATRLQNSCRNEQLCETGLDSASGPNRTACEPPRNTSLPREWKQGDASSINTQLQGSDHLMVKSEGVFSSQGKIIHNIDHMNNVIHCSERGNTSLLNRPLKSDKQIVDEHCSAIFVRENNLVKHLELNPCCQNNQTLKLENSASICDHLCSISEEVTKWNSSNCKLSLNYEDSAKPAELYFDSKTHPNEQLKCEMCQNSIQNPANLRCHKFAYTGNKPNVCTICGRAFSNRSQLNIHHRTHSENKPCKCDVCKIQFSESTKLKNHKKIQMGKEPFICEVCGYSFLILSSLKNHMKTHSGEKPYKCHVCDFASTRSSNLKAHLLVHSGDKKYSCDKCNACFSDNAKLKRHAMVHTGLKPYRCEICGASFADKSHLTVHLRIHSGEKPFSCTLCSLTFVESSKLKTHLRTHTGEKPYVCEICGLTFAVLYGLKSHMRRHTGEMLYKCNICTYASSQSSNVKVHMLVHSRDKSYVCDKCGAAFHQLSKLNKHKIIHQDKKWEN